MRLLQTYNLRVHARKHAYIKYENIDMITCGEEFKTLQHYLSINNIQLYKRNPEYMHALENRRL